MMVKKCGNCTHWRPNGQRHDPVYGPCGVRAYDKTDGKHSNENEILRSVFRDYVCREHEPTGIDKPDS